MGALEGGFVSTIFKRMKFTETSGGIFGLHLPNIASKFANIFF
jgi:hypothetical protein